MRLALGLHASLMILSVLPVTVVAPKHPPPCAAHHQPLASPPRYHLPASMSFSWVNLVVTLSKTVFLPLASSPIRHQPIPIQEAILQTDLNIQAGTKSHHHCHYRRTQNHTTTVHRSSLSFLGLERQFTALIRRFSH